MSFRTALIHVARGEVGYVRKPSRWNKYAAELFPTVTYGAYCGSFVGWCMYHAGVDARAAVWLPYVPSIEQWARKHGAWKTSGHKDGDLVIYDWQHDGLADHVGIVWRNESASGYRAIEGNTSTGSAGSQSNGGRVAVRYRGRKSIRGWVDVDKLAAAGKATSAKPAQHGDAKTSGALVVDGRWGKKSTQEVQQRLKVHAPDLQVDGRAGADTWNVWLKQAGMVPDGKIDSQRHRAAELGNGIVPGKSWRYVGKPAKGSRLVRALQGTCGATVTGIWDETTSRKLQHWLNEHPAQVPAAK